MNERRKRESLYLSPPAAHHHSILVSFKIFEFLLSGYGQRVRGDITDDTGFLVNEMVMALHVLLSATPRHNSCPLG